MDMTALTLSSVEEVTLFQAKRGQYNTINNRWANGLALCIRGQITYTTGNDRFVLHQGRAVLLPKGADYSFVCDEDGTFPVVNFSCVGLTAKELTEFELPDAASCLRTFEQLRQAFLDPDTRLKRFALTYELLYKITDRQKAMPDPLRRAIRYMDEHLGDPDLSNVKVAEEVGISEVYLRKLFMTHERTTPKQYLLGRRIAKAERLLTDTALSVTAVAEACGFSSVYHFCRAFKQKTGLTPTAYAAAHTVYQI